MSKFVRALVGLVAGYGIGVAACALLITLFSGNTHDKSLEIAMTSAFFGGPIGAVLGVVAGLVWQRRPETSA